MKIPETGAENAAYKSYPYKKYCEEKYMTDINEMKKRIIYLQSLIQQKQYKLNPKNGKGVNMVA